MYHTWYEETQNKTFYSWLKRTERHFSSINAVALHLQESARSSPKLLFHNKAKTITWKKLTDTEDK